MSQPVCAGCKKAMRPVKNGVWWLSRLMDNSPYRMTSCDKWACPVCGAQILTGFAAESIYYHDEKFNDLLKSAAENNELIYENQDEQNPAWLIELLNK